MNKPILRVVNWERFQHYKERTPPWIKLHAQVLNNYEFTNLPDEAKAHLMLLWVLASQMNNEVPADPKWLGNKLSLTATIDLVSLQRAGFIELNNHASATLASCLQDACLEAEREAEREAEADPPIAPPRGASKLKAKDRRLACFIEAQSAYPQAFNRHLSGETTGRNSYTADLQAYENHGFATEAALHEHVMGQIRKASNSERWLEDGGQFIPGIGKWFKNRLWRGSFGRDESPLSRLGKAGQQQAINCQDFLEAGNG